MAGLNEEDIRFIEDNLPPPYNSVERYGEEINRRLSLHKALCGLMIKEVEKALQSLQKINGNRFFCRIDSSNQSKSKERIIQKIRTKKDENGNPHTWENFTSTIKDLARFRVVVNFLSDVEKVVKAIEGHDPIIGSFNIEKKNTIDEPLKKRHSGDRSVKLVLSKKTGSLSVEIQIMTAFQEAWDKKDHPLLYKKTRLGENASEQLKALSLITSELLYAADRYFE